MATNSINPERSFMHWKTKLKRRGATKEQLRPGASNSIYPTQVKSVKALGAKVGHKFRGNQYTKVV